MYLSLRSNIRKLPPQKKEKHKEISLNQRQQIHKTYLIDTILNIVKV